MSNEQRRQNYNTLRAIGFTKEEANRLKGSSEEKIWSLVTQRETKVQEIRQEWAKKSEQSGGIRYQDRDAVQARRRENYKALRDAGYSPSEANKLKGAHQIKVQALIDKKQGKSIGTIHKNIKQSLIQAGIKPDIAEKLKTQPVDKLQRLLVSKNDPTAIRGSEIKKPRGIQYAPVSQADKRYLSEYTYKISYMVKNKDGSKEEKWITLTSPDKMSKRAVIEEARNILFESAGGDDDDSHYSSNGGTILVSTITISEAYYNDM